MAIVRNRGRYVLLILGVIAAGLLSRELIDWLPNWIGDILWGLMVFLIAGFIFRDRPALINAIVAAFFR